jgi:hypothetical protein
MDFRPVKGTESWRGMERKELLTSWQPGDRKRAMETERSSKQDVAPKNMLQVTYFVQLGLTSESFQHFKINPTNYESIHGFIF